jgi:hypothetical protein
MGKSSGLGNTVGMDDTDPGQMKPLPLPVRIAAGLVATAVEQARGLPRTVVELPVTAVSQVLQASMRVQQKVTELAIRGDRALGALRPVEEKPSWATFDEDLPPQRNGRSSSVTELRPQPRREPAPMPEPEPDPRPAAADVAAKATAADAGSTATLAATDERLPTAATATAGADLAGPAEPDTAAVTLASAAAGEGPNVLPGYAGMTIPQLRARLRKLSPEDLRALLEYETAHGNRPPFVTMLSNRISTVTSG